MRSRYLLAGFLAPFLAAAQPASIDSPGFGVAYDSRSLALRPIRGIPGASLLGDAMDSGTPLVNVAISTRQNLALGVTPEGQVRLVRFGGSPAAQSLDAAYPSPTRIVLAPGGRAALLIGPQIQLVTGLDNIPAFGDFSYPGQPAPPVVFALSDDGQALMLASGTVWLISPDGGATNLPLPSTIGAAAFRPNSHDIVAVTNSGDVYVTRQAGPNAEVQQIHSGDDATADPAGVQFSPDGTRVFLANASGMLSAIDVRTGTAASLLCHCKPTGLDPLHDDAVFRLNEISDRPLMLFDASSPDLRIWFVPADTIAINPQRSAR
jgi:hypothetical protein